MVLLVLVFWVIRDLSVKPISMNVLLLLVIMSPLVWMVSMLLLVLVRRISMVIYVKWKWKNPMCSVDGVQWSGVFSLLLWVCLLSSAASVLSA
jgi:hypothetical protein